MARKGQVQIQESVETDEELELFLEAHAHQLICENRMEVYSEFCGPCLATANAIRKGKMDIGQDGIAMVKKGKLTRAMFGANGIELCRLIEEEMAMEQKEAVSGEERPKQEISEELPEECERLEQEMKQIKAMADERERQRVATLAARKKRVAERLSRVVSHMNFILFFPHCHRAYYDLYENWDLLNIQVAAKEEFQITEEIIPEVLYMSDIDNNDACLHALCDGPALIVLFKMFETDTRDFVKLLRHALYEMIPVPKEDEPPEKQLPPIPAFERYASISKTPRQVRRDRYNAVLEKQRQEEEERLRLEAEQARIAREAEEERQLEEKRRKDEERMARIAAGLPAEPEPEEVAPPEGEEVAEGVEGKEGEEAAEGAEGAEGAEAAEAADPQALPEGEKAQQTELEVQTETAAVPVEEEPAVLQEFDSDVEVEDEPYIPPGGMFVPGLYTPPNSLAKANSIALFFTKIVSSVTKLETEHLPPHVLVMFGVDKRKEIGEIIQQYKDEILNVGIFVGDDLDSLEHVAYTIKQYDNMDRPLRYKDRLALMVSRKRSLPLLQLVPFNPNYISLDRQAGVFDCLKIFPVGYGDGFEDEESIVEEEIVEEEPVAAEVTRVESQQVKLEEEDDDEDEEA